MLTYHSKYLIPILIFDLLVSILVFGQAGSFYLERSDTSHFVSQIEIMRGNENLENLEGAHKELVYYRLSKPLYALVARVLPQFAPETVIVTINLIFLVGLSISFYLLLVQFEFSNNLAFVGSLWLASSYPVLKYGLALGTDISGWFFTILTAFLFMLGFKKDKNKYLLLASLTAFVGSLSKETAIAGLSFSAVFLLVSQIDIREKIKKFAFLLAPFIFLELIFLFTMHQYNLPSLFSWWSYNYNIYFAEFYKISYLLTNEFLAFHLIALLAIFETFFILKNKIWKDPKQLALLGSLLVASVSCLLWPVFYYRVLFIQFLIIVPLALRALDRLQNKFIQYAMVALPPVLSFVLFFLIKKI